ncbi:hypothetical protein SLEP1_g26956 [Rubroshorea leprosula]|uniref:Uncharacterized protein n=1 Tax=Rubroshorea leprosula TaxID=152421 RepID=A0AAV5JY37_9ROSI|nr:hypothetical protein SLEP1_g26956 [Rubroshorea leprosula]
MVYVAICYYAFLLLGTSAAAKFLRDNGIALFMVQDEILNLLQKADMTFTSPEHPPLTEQAQKALDWAVEEKLKSARNSRITRYFQNAHYNKAENLEMYFNRAILSLIHRRAPNSILSD